MLTRRAFLGSALAASAFAQSSRSKPNVLFLSVDDMNDWVGCLGGYPGVHTPNIDRLARRGVLFRDAHCSSPICNPSRTANLTGLRPSTTGIYGNDQYWRPVLPDVTTLPEFFRENGYHVAGAGKVFHHVAGFNPPDQWDDFRIQEFDDPWYRRTDYYPWVEKIPNPPGHPFNGMAGDDGFAGEFDWGALPDRPEETYGDMAAVRYGQQFLGKRHDKPFFLAVGLWHPHIPLFAPQEYFDLYPSDRVKLPEVLGNDLEDVPEIARRIAAARLSEHDRILREGKWKDAVQAYLACISFADKMVGYVLDALEKGPNASNTIIVLWSDHGWHLGEKRHWHKSTLWQRATHVPMIWAGPGVEQAGVDRSQPVELIDMYPTLAELCGLDQPAGLDGVSLGPQLRSPLTPKRPAVCTFQPNNHAVITPQWRYIRYRDATEELYDRAKDPNEWTNLANRPEHASLKLQLAHYMPKTSAQPQPGRGAYDFDFATYSYRRKG